MAVFFVSKVIVVFLVGDLILARLFRKANRYRIVPFLLGLILYIVLRALPYLGCVVESAAIVLGLGAMWLALCAPKPQAKPDVEGNEELETVGDKEVPSVHETEREDATPQEGVIEEPVVSVAEQSERIEEAVEDTES